MQRQLTESKKARGTSHDRHASEMDLLRKLSQERTTHEKKKEENLRRQILEQENSKSYLGMQGLEAYGPLVRNLLAPGKLENGRAVTLQTPGGTGALRVDGDFLRQKVNARRIWVSTPTWAN